MWVEQLLSNRMLIAPFYAWWAAQILKVILNLIRDKRINLRYLTSSGGMPSAHSALVMSLMTAVGREQGLGSAAFAISTIFAAIVMYDAAGVRRAVGIQARILNKMIDEAFAKNPSFASGRLLELVGHTPIQVIVGATLGVAVGMLVG